MDSIKIAAALVVKMDREQRRLELKRELTEAERRHLLTLREIRHLVSRN